mmetsp:Transcript_59627/g.129424  ORF Transcript_59627/g.129424 Transcript_59627/m.129424 type:complete len:110 (-) Transcript_59627:137-466(-)
MSDRHASNILLKKADSASIYIDFDAISEVGYNMPIKELLSVRLTPNTIAMLDFEGVNGLISQLSVQLLQEMRRNQNSLMPLIQVWCDNYFEGMELGKHEFNIEIKDHCY